jgi:hypothetical protein
MAPAAIDHLAGLDRERDRVAFATIDGDEWIRVLAAARAIKQAAKATTGGGERMRDVPARGEPILQNMGGVPQYFSSVDVVVLVRQALPVAAPAHARQIVLRGSAARAMQRSAGSSGGP